MRKWMSREFVLPLATIFLGFILIWTGRANPEILRVFLTIGIGGSLGYNALRNVQRFIGKRNNKK